MNAATWQSILPSNKNVSNVTYAVTYAITYAVTYTDSVTLLAIDDLPQ
mgnify:CR=1 FL=1